jgi:hypothetical protein
MLNGTLGALVKHIKNKEFFFLISQNEIYIKQPKVFLEQSVPKAQKRLQEFTNTVSEK